MNTVQDCKRKTVVVNKVNYLIHLLIKGMKTMVLNGTLREEALHTANFVEKLDRLFDVLNSR